MFVSTGSTNIFPAPCQPWYLDTGIRTLQESWEIRARVIIRRLQDVSRGCFYGDGVRNAQRQSRRWRTSVETIHRTAANSTVKRDGGVKLCTALTKAKDATNRTASQEIPGKLRYKYNIYLVSSSRPNRKSLARTYLCSLLVVSPQPSTTYSRGRKRPAQLSADARSSCSTKVEGY